MLNPTILPHCPWKLASQRLKLSYYSKSPSTVPVYVYHAIQMSMLVETQRASLLARQGSCAHGRQERPDSSSCKRGRTATAAEGKKPWRQCRCSLLPSMYGRVQRSRNIIYNIRSHGLFGFILGILDAWSIK